MHQHSIALPPDLTCCLKALITLEGLGRQLDPDFQGCWITSRLLCVGDIERYEPNNLLKRGQIRSTGCRERHHDGGAATWQSRSRICVRGKIKVDLRTSETDRYLRAADQQNCQSFDAGHL